MGCHLNELPGQLGDDDGVVRPIRYLSSPESDLFVSLYGLKNDDKVPPMTVESWERALGISIPKGDGH